MLIICLYQIAAFDSEPYFRAIVTPTLVEACTDLDGDQCCQLIYHWRIQGLSGHSINMIESSRADVYKGVGASGREIFFRCRNVHADVPFSSALNQDAGWLMRCQSPLHVWIEFYESIYIGFDTKGFCLSSEDIAIRQQSELGQVADESAFTEPSSGFSFPLFTAVPPDSD